MKKKLIALTLALALCLSLIPLTALAAAPKAVLTVTTADDNIPGAEISLILRISENPGISRLKLSLDYDKTRLEPAGKSVFLPMKATDSSDAFTDWDCGEEALFDGFEAVTFNGNLLTLNFRIKDDAPVGKASVSVKAEAGQPDGSKVTLKVVSGGVNVLKPGSHVHTWDEGKVTREPTCTKAGSVTYKCTGCNETKTEELLPLGHNWSPWEISEEPTATAPGTEVRRCRTDGCDAEETREITADTVVLTLEAAGGKVVPKERTVIKDAPIGLLPTPTREGYTFEGWFSDPDTGSLVDGSSVFPTDATLWAHWSEGEEEDGCRLEVVESVAAPGEPAVITLRLTGNPGIAGLAFRFGWDNQVMTYEDFADAELTGWMVDKQAIWASAENFTEDGDILRLQFAVSDKAKEGTMDFTVEDIVAFNEELEPVKITAGDGKISIRKILPGDADGNGTVDILDLMLLCRYTADNTVKLDLDNADLNGNGRIDSEDIAALQKQLASED